MDYSVLMSVYFKENPEFLRISMESIFKQTIQTNDFVLVCDGLLTPELDAIILQMEKNYGNILNVVRLSKNGGLGNALNVGLKHCKNELVARMDSDDISFPNRCEKQLAYFVNKDGLDIVGGTIEEFVEDPHLVTGKRKLPVENEKIRQFSKMRNPFNHVSVMFRKSSVIKVGGYNEEYHLFEDYYLWVRMLANGCIGANLEDSLVKVRSLPDQIKRRGGIKYCVDLLRFHMWMLKSGWSTPIDFIIGAIPHAIICVLPNCARASIYEHLREH